MIVFKKNLFFEKIIKNKYFINITEITIMYKIFQPPLFKNSFEYISLMNKRLKNQVRDPVHKLSSFLFQIIDNLVLLH